MTISMRQIGQNSLINDGYADNLAIAGKSTTAAKDFEAMLLSTIFEKLEESVSNSEGLVPGGDTLRALGAQQLASVISSAGGIGIAKLIAPYLQKHETSVP